MCVCVSVQLLVVSCLSNHCDLSVCVCMRCSLGWKAVFGRGGAGRLSLCCWAVRCMVQHAASCITCSSKPRLLLQFCLMCVWVSMLVRAWWLACTAGLHPPLRDQSVVIFAFSRQPTFMLRVASPSMQF